MRLLTILLLCGPLAMSCAPKGEESDDKNTGQSSSNLKGPVDGTWRMIQLKCGDADSVLVPKATFEASKGLEEDAGMFWQTLEYTGGFGIRTTWSFGCKQVVDMGLAYGSGSMDQSDATPTCTGSCAGLEAPCSADPVTLLVGFEFTEVDGKSRMTQSVPLPENGLMDPCNDFGQTASELTFIYEKMN